MMDQALQILLVHGHAEAARHLGRLLEAGPARRHHVRVAGTCQEGIAALDAGQVDACLVALRLGARYGADFIRKARALAPGLPCILLTGTDEEQAEQEAARAGAADWLPEAGLTAGRVRQAVRHAVERARLQDAEAVLTERVKQLRTLHESGRILNEAERPVAERFQRLAERLPQGWAHPEITAVRIVFGDREFASPGFRESPWMMSAAVADGEWQASRVDVALTSPPRHAGPAPFREDEQDLLDDLALLIGDVLRRDWTARMLSRTVAALNEAVLVVRRRLIVDANPAAERIFGFSRGELIGASTEKLHVDRTAFAEFGSVSEPLLEREGVFHGSYRMRRRSGALFDAEQTVRLLDPHEGLAGGVVSVIRDVSERVRADADLRASEERFRRIAESIHDVFWIRRPGNAPLEYVSPAFTRIWGRPVGELLDNPRLWVDSILPSDRQRVAEAQRLPQEEGHEIEYRIVRPDGEVRWIFERAFPLRENGRVIRVIGVAEDVTERKLAEERFTVLSQEIADGIYVIAPDGLIRFATASAQAILGYPSEELQGRNALDLVHPDDRSVVRDMLSEVIHRPGGVARSQYRAVTRQGEARYLESVGRNRIDHPAIRGVVVTTRDITERRRLEEQLLQSQKLEAIGRLAGGIAHDFNNLLTVIRSQTDLMLLDVAEQRGRDSTTLRVELELIQGAAARAAALTSQLLAFGREQILQPRVIDLSEVLSDIGRLLERVIGEDVVLERELDQELPAVRVDPGQLEQVVMNLAINARDAMPEGGTLTLRTRREQVSPDAAASPAGELAPVNVVLEVQDTGIGMDADVRSRIFEPFFTTKEKGKGTGLGLAMVYGVVTQSGGTVRVESEPGHGTAFILSFPAVSQKAAVAVAPEAAEPTRGMLDARMLVVEDDESVRRVTVRILKRAGIGVVAVDSAEGGLAALHGDVTIDLVLTDLVLPGMSGRALVDRMREDGFRQPIIVMSGYAADSPGERRDLPEDIRFVQKPFTPEGLVHVVREALGSGP